MVVSKVSVYTAMKESGIAWVGAVPKHWKTRTLYQLSTQVKDKNKKLIEQNLLSLSYGKIKRKDINSTDGLLPASFDGYNIVQDGDIVLRLTDLQNDKTSLRVGLATERGIITSAYTTLRPLDIRTSRYMYYLLHAFDLVKGFYGMGSGVRQGLTYDEVKELKVMIPDLEEQEAIATCLETQCSKIDSIIEEAKVSIEEYFKLKQSLITQTVTKGLGKANDFKETKVPWIGKIPSNWQFIKMSLVCSVITDFVASGSFADLAKNVTYLDKPNYAMLIRATDVSEKGRKNSPVYINESAYKFLSNSNLFGGEIMIPNIGGVGEVYIIPKLYNRMSLAPNSIMVKSNFNNRYIYYYFKSIAGRQSLIDIAESTAQPKFNKTDLRQMKIVIPSMDEQNHIVEFLDYKCIKLDELVSEKLTLISDLEAYKRAFIYEAVTGKRKVV